MNDEARVPMKDGEPVKAEEKKEEKKEKPEAQQFDAEAYQATQETKARKGGWVPQEEWEGNPDAWVTANDFNSREGLIGELRAQKRTIEGFDARLANLNQVHEATLTAKIQELTLKKHEAALEGGEAAVETIKNLDHQINTLSQTPAPAQAIPAELNEWNANNAWINQPGAKSTYARSLFSSALAGGRTVAQAITYVDSEIAREYPPQVTKPQASETEGGSKPSGFKKSTPKLTMSDITAEEHKMMEALPGAWADKSEKEILQAVADSRAK